MVANDTRGIEQEARVTRAATEGGEYAWDRKGDLWVCGSKSGRTYFVTRQACGCDDYKYRCGPRGQSCKHMIALGVKLIELGELS